MLRTICTLAATVVLVATPAAGADVVASSVGGFEGGPALAADGSVVVGERTGDGGLRVLAFDPRSRAAREVTAFGSLTDPTTYPELAVTGTRSAVTATRDVLRQVGRAGGEQAQPTPLTTEAFVLLPVLARLAACPAPLRSSFPQLDAVAGDGFVATVGEACGASRSAVRVRTGSGGFDIPATPGSDPSFPVDISGLRATGPMLARVETSLDVGSPLRRTLVVASGATGRVLLRRPLDAALQALGADGSVVLTRFPACALDIVSPVSSISRQLPADLCPSPVEITRGQSAAAIAGGRVVYSTLAGHAVVEPGGSAHRVAETSGASPVAFDGQTVYAVRRDCGADRLLAVAASAAGVSAAAPAGSACLVRRAGPGRVRAGRDGRVRIALRCPNGCRGTLRLVEQRSARRERVAGSRSYAVDAGRIVVRVKLARWARARAGCRGGLRVHAMVYPVGDDHRTAAVRRERLGPYRIASRSRCRRGGGPAFTAPRPGPRP